MRTGIYVYSPTTLTIAAKEPIVLTSYDNKSYSFDSGGTVSADLPAGIYKAITDYEISVTGPNVEVVVVPDDKDPFPDAPAEATTTFNLTSSSIKSFFTIAGLKSATF
ncbi:MAG TPA: hypothetical protein VFT22_33010 [Kofleriaceae bacterium]|nr:hypothetical protein [Kofleriaceae bacterium]